MKNILDYEKTQWRNKYAPKTRKDLILPQAIHNMVDNFMKPNEKGRLNNIPHFLFVGNAGMGKTNLMKVIINELNPNMLFINGSSEARIDDLRTKITHWVETKNYTPDSKTDFKIIFIDEIGNSSPAFQKGIRSFVEEHEHRVRFFMTSNKLDLHEALESRFANSKINFNEEYSKISSEDFKKLQTKTFYKLSEILKQEHKLNPNLEWEKVAIVNILKQHFPDVRKCINILNKSANMYNGKITLENTSLKFNTLISLMKEGKPEDLFNFIELQTDLTIFYTLLLKHIMNSDVYDSDKKIKIGLIITEHEYRDVQARNKKSNFFRMLLLIRQVIDNIS